ncbi:Major facilitator superfamily domain-containing protein [Rhodotorula toruloides]|uniref:Major facilitator superfamily domain-containing protein n=1 Tax=Rhodotorula toruloides TaxID=5286 RepID=A0A2S9ZVW9_RHOTO|nr:Major facilitator superfamily domain-containing protein [Rhodotorula toruloides]
MQSLRLRRRLNTHYSLYIRDAPNAFGGRGKSEVTQPSGEGDGEGSASGPEAVKAGQDGQGAFVVAFSTPSDPLNPQDWPLRTRLFTTFLLSLLVLFVGSASSMNAFVAKKAAADLGVSETIADLDTALFLTGFGVAAPIMAPLSELAGRNPIYLISLLAVCLLEIGVAQTHTIWSRCVLRFLAGCFATTPLSNAGAAMGDLWDREERSWTFPLFAVAGFFGPCLGPVISGWVAQSSLSYRWTDWIQAAWAGLLFIVTFLLLPETYPPTLLGWKAAAIRECTRNPRYLTALEHKRQHIPYRVDFVKTLARPFVMLVQEPIVLCFLAYLTLVYIVLFGSLVAYPLIFVPYDLSSGILGTSFLSIAVGVVLCGACAPLMLWDYRRGIEQAWKQGFDEVEPEVRLRVAMVGTWAVPAGLAWNAWVCYQSVSVFGSYGAQALFGFGILSCFISTYQYLIDSYGHAAASAMSATTFLRYPVAGSSVLFTRPMYHRLDRHWALSLLAGLALVMSFIPFIFYLLGRRTRRWSRWTMH